MLSEIEIRRRNSVVWELLVLCSRIALIGMVVIGLALIVGAVLPAWEQVAYVSSANPGSDDLYLLEVDRGIPVRLTQSQTDFIRFFVKPNWSLDGRQLFAAGNSQGEFELFELDVTDKQTKPVLDSSPSPMTGDPTISPNGQYMTYSTLNSSYSASTSYILDMDTQTPIQLEKIIIGNVTWTPDSQKVAFISSSDGEQIHLLVVDSATGATIQEVLVGELVVGGMSWSPDSTHLLYSAALTRQLPTSEYDIFSLDVTTGNVTNLTESPLADMDPAWSPDGESIAFASQRNGANGIYIMNANGGEVRIVTSNQGGTMPVWSLDGQRIIFQSLNDRELYIVNVDGSGLRQLTVNKVADSFPVWRPCDC